MNKAFFGFGDLIIGLVLVAAFLPLIMSTARMLLNPASLGFGLIEDKSERASGVEMQDIGSYTMFSKLTFMFAPYVDDGFTNNWVEDSYNNYDRTVFINLGTNISPSIVSNTYHINTNQLDIGTTLTGSVIAGGGLGQADASKRSYGIALNRFGDVYFTKESGASRIH
jgi:hypothetical protein